MHVIVNVSISLNQCKLNTRVSWRLVELTMRYRGIFFLVFVFPHGVRPRQLLRWRRPRWFSTSSDLCFLSLKYQCVPEDWKTNAFQGLKCHCVQRFDFFYSRRKYVSCKWNQFYTRQFSIAVVRRLFKMVRQMVERRLKSLRRLFHPLFAEVWSMLKNSDAYFPFFPVY